MMTGWSVELRAQARCLVYDTSGGADAKPVPRQRPFAVFGRSAVVPARSDEPHEVVVPVDMDNFPAV